MSVHQAEIIEALKNCFDLEYFKLPSSLSWKSAIFGTSVPSSSSSASSAVAAKPIRIDMLLMLQPAVIRAALQDPHAGAGRKGDAAPLVVAAIHARGGEIGLSLAASSAPGKEMIQFTLAGSSTLTLDGSKSENSGDAAKSSSATMDDNNQQQQQSRPQMSTTAEAEAEGPSRPNNSAGLATAATSDSVAATAASLLLTDNRTVFASPIHFKAAETDIVDFFSQFGKVTSVERRKFLERGVVKLRPSVFVMFSTPAEAQACVAARPSYGRCPSSLGSLFVPRLTVSLKEDPISRDAINDEESKSQFNQQNNNNNNTNDNSNNQPSHRKLVTRGLICIARGIPQDVPLNDVRSKLGTIQGVAGASQPVIDAVYFPPEQYQTCNNSNNTKICYVYCTSLAAAATLVSCYKRVFQNNEKYAERLGVAVPALERCQDAEEDVAMELYGDAVAARTQKKLDRNATSTWNNNSHHSHHQQHRRDRE